MSAAVLAATIDGRLLCRAVLLDRNNQRIDLRQDQDNFIGAQLRPPLPQPGQVEGWSALVDHALLQIFDGTARRPPPQREVCALRHFRAPDQLASNGAVACTHERVRRNVAEKVRSSHIGALAGCRRPLAAFRSVIGSFARR